MKKIISIILILTLLISAVPLSVFATDTTEETDVLTQKQALAKMLKEMYGEDGILEEGVNYTWDYSQVSETETSENSESEIMPLWNAGSSSENYSVHGKIIDEANEYSEGKIPEKYLTLVKDICQRCDTKWSIHIKDENGNEIDNPLAVQAVHGSSNYIATLKYLWDYAKELAKYEEDEITEDLITDVGRATYKTLPDYLKNNEEGEERQVVTMLKYLRKRTITILTTFYDRTEGNQTKKGRCKYIIFGMLMHLFGDVYAHRLCVPTVTVKSFKDSFNEDDFDETRMFAESDFSESDQTAMTELVNNQKLPFVQIGNYTAKGTLTERQLHKKYVDDADFHPLRVEESVITAAYFLLWFTDGFYPEILIPVDFELYKYDTYYDDLLG